MPVKEDANVLLRVLQVAVTEVRKIGKDLDTTIDRFDEAEGRLRLILGYEVVKGPEPLLGLPRPLYFRQD